MSYWSFDELPKEETVQEQYQRLLKTYGFKAVSEAQQNVKRQEQIVQDAERMRNLPEMSEPRSEFEPGSFKEALASKLVDIGNYITVDDPTRLGLFDAMGETMQKLGRREKLTAGDYFWPAAEVAGLVAMKPSISSLRSAATKAQPFRHYVDDAVMYDRYGKRMGQKGISGAELLGSAADVGLNTAFAGMTLEDILRKMSEQ